MDGQDWSPLTIRGVAPAVKSGSAGQQIVERRPPGSAQMAKLAEAEDPKKPKLLSREAVATIQAYRRDHSITQKQLDQQLAFPSNTMNRLEARAIAPSTAQLNTLNRVLKTGLTLES